MGTGGLPQYPYWWKVLLCLIVHLNCEGGCEMEGVASLLGRDQGRAVARQPASSNKVTPLLGVYQECWGP